MPPLCRSYHEKRSDSNWITSELIMEWICYPIFDADDHAYDTSSVVHLRSSPDLTPDAILLRLFRNAHHPDSLSAQLTVVWWLLPEAATGGPSSISIAVTSRPTLLSCHTSSQPREPPPQLLTEPDLRVSPHPALPIQPLAACLFANAPLTLGLCVQYALNNEQLAPYVLAISCIYP